MYWNTPNKDGVTWMRIYEAYGRIVPEMPDIPVGFAPLLELFSKLSARRPEGMSGPMPITIESIYAWSRLAGMELGTVPFEILLMLDDEWIAALNDVKRDFKAREETE